MVRPQHVEERAVGDAVGLVQDEDRRMVGQLELVEDLLDGADLLLGLRARRVDHVQEQVGLARLLERGLERGDQRVRQVPDESDGVGEQDLPAAAEPPATGAGVEGGEELVLDEDAGVGQGIHEGALAGVGVADERDRRRIAAAGDLALLARLDLRELRLQVLDPVPDEPAVFFELLLARPTHPDPPLVSREVGPHPLEPWHRVFELRELDLEMRLVRAAPGWRRCRGSPRSGRSPSRPGAVPGSASARGRGRYRR